ncbi:MULTISPECIES: flagellar basal body P-ring formation chaperone FlgA [unclassified Sulfitobacter]|uniref:flagellar basal body P-ring formation chaperone FlgA n=1 Tax=unclassified Sulfitobacter TaxID=196795 RepID=UPI0023E256FF|nr:MULTISPECIES: flagellar basal body P-ring formation chaperone FlgA [unclassified Sulfitobacter]
MARRFMMRVIVPMMVLSCLLLSGLPAAASAMKVVDLIEERALSELDAQLPANGQIEIRMAEGAVSEGEFIKEFWIDPDSGQFIANIFTEYGETHRVWGVAVMTIQVPVPARRIMPEEIVTAADITMVEMPMQRVGNFAISSAEALVGQQVRRMLVPGRPVPRQSVIPPIIVSRGDKVKILLSYGGLQLTAVGRAMADAHAGQEIRVVNLSSNKAISAIATKHGTVEVTQ